MYNELIHIGPVTVYGYGLMTAIGILSAYLVGVFRAKKHGLLPERIFGIVVWCCIFGYAGSKLLYTITVFDRVVKNPAMLLDLSNGWVVYGGILGGILGAVIYCRRKNLSFISYFDLCMPEVALAQGFGRIGCFLAGCCYGEKTDLPIGIVFSNSSYAPNGVPLIPTQLISSGLDFLNFFVLVWISRRTKRRGVVGGCYLIFYSVGRFVMEFFRGDLERGLIGPLSTSQFIAIFVFLAGVIVVLGAGGFEGKKARNA